MKLNLQKFLATKSSLNRHLQIVHGVAPSRKNQRGIICTECDDYSSHRMEDLRSHLETTHGIILEKDERCFEGMTDFEAWKNEMETAERCSFVRLNRMHKLTTGEKRLIFTCHRSGRPERSSTEKQVQVESVKIGRTCPSSLSATERKDGKVLVIHYKTHLGHDCHLKSLNLSKKLRTMTADQIVSVISDPVILKTVSDSLNEDGETQLHLLEDLQNIHKESPKDVITIVDYQAALRFRCNMVQEMISDVHPEDAQELMKALDQLIAIFSAKISARGSDPEVATSTPEGNERPTNLSIEPERKLQTIKCHITPTKSKRRLSQQACLEQLEVKQNQFNITNICYITLDQD